VPTYYAAVHLTMHLLILRFQLKVHFYTDTLQACLRKICVTFLRFLMSSKLDLSSSELKIGESVTTGKTIVRQFWFIYAYFRVRSPYRSYIHNVAASQLLRRYECSFIMTSYYYDPTHLCTMQPGIAKCQPAILTTGLSTLQPGLYTYLHCYFHASHSIIFFQGTKITKNIGHLPEHNRLVNRASTT